MSERCTFRRCPEPPVRQLQQSTGGAVWFGCAAHWPAMAKALEIGMPGAMSGSAHVEIIEYEPLADRAAS